MTVPNEYQLGASVKISTQFKDENGTLTDPTAVTLTLITPDGTTANLTPIANPTVGNYEYVYETVMVGSHYYRWYGNGVVDTAGEFGFVVKPSNFI